MERSSLTSRCGKWVLPKFHNECHKDKHCDWNEYYATLWHECSFRLTKSDQLIEVV